MRIIRVTNPFSTEIEVENMKIAPKATETVCMYTAEKKPLVNKLKKLGYIVKVIDGVMPTNNVEVIKEEKITEGPVEPSVDLEPKVEEAPSVDLEKQPENLESKKVSDNDNKEATAESKPANTTKKSPEQSKAKSKPENKGSNKA